MLEFLTVVSLVILVVVGLMVTAAWLAPCRVRPRRLVGVGDLAVAYGRLAFRSGRQ